MNKQKKGNTMNGKETMIMHHLKGRDIVNERVLEAMKEVKRELFVPEGLKYRAYEDSPLPIGREQTISQPFIVAYMAQVLDPQPNEKVLEVGSGCGYNAAVLAQLSAHVYSVEIIKWLADLAQMNLREAGVENVAVKYGDGYHGWPENAPFDKIMLTAATPMIPDELKEQLKTGGKILAPI
ncbi:MAG: protein-L-isoaspartate(D-aspartate) O-methyltransferase, partial [Bacteroidales bacterium]